MICAQCGSSLPQDFICPACGGGLLDGRYVLLELLSSNSPTSLVYRALNIESGVEVAIKELSFLNVNALKTLSLFEREARVLKSLSHASLPEFIEFLDQDAGKHTSIFLVQELIPGTTLQEEMQHTRHDERAVIDIMAELLEPLIYLRNLHPAVVHRDIKPSNVMRRADTGALVLIDFGSVAEVSSRHPGQGSTIAGTFGFMAPEQFRGEASPATDIYGLAALAVALLSRQPVYERLNTHAPQGMTWDLGLSPGFQRLLDRMLHDDPKQRPTALEVHNALSRGLDEPEAHALILPHPTTALPAWLQALTPEGRRYVIMGMLMMMLSVGLGVSQAEVLVAIGSVLGVCGAMFFLTGITWRAKGRARAPAFHHPKRSASATARDGRV